MPLITDIVPQKNNKKFFSIFVDVKYMFSLSSEDLSFLNLKINENISQRKLNELIEEYVLQKAKNYAYRLISHKMYSEMGLKEKLLNRYPEFVADKVLKSLKKLGYINDKRFIYEYAKNRVETKLIGPLKLLYDLLNNKFDRELVKTTVGKVYNEIDEYKIIKKLFEKKFKDLKLKRDVKMLNKIKNYFLSRGFTFETISRIINDKLGIDEL